MPKETLFSFLKKKKLPISIFVIIGYIFGIVHELEEMFFPGSDGPLSIIFNPPLLYTYDIALALYGILYNLISQVVYVLFIQYTPYTFEAISKLIGIFARLAIISAGSWFAYALTMYLIVYFAPRNLEKMVFLISIIILVLLSGINPFILSRFW